MTTPSASSTPAALSASDINTENGYASNQQMSFDDAVVRTLAAAPGTGTTISMASLRGKSARRVLHYTAPKQNANLSNDFPGVPTAYIWEVYVDPGVYLWSDSTALPGLTTGTGAWPAGLNIINQGYIIGKGGTGGKATGQSSGSIGTPGGPALELQYPATIDNTNPAAYIAGGGGGGYGSNQGGGGGGAGGGTGGSGDWNPTAGAINATPQAGGAGGAIGQIGGQGPSAGLTYRPARPGGTGNYTYVGAGGGGGRILPGVGGQGNDVVMSNPDALGRHAGSLSRDPQSTLSGFGGGSGGGAGQGRGVGFFPYSPNPAAYNGYNGTDAAQTYFIKGGDANQPGTASIPSGQANGIPQTSGGGGWGAAGGSQNGVAGAPGGKAVALNGNSVTWTASDTTRVWGAVA